MRDADIGRCYGYLGGFFIVLGFLMKLEEIDKRYEVLRDGRIISRKFNRAMRPFFDKYGYECILLSDGKKYHNKRVHRLVAEKYLGSLKNRYVIHVNGDIHDNSVDNLKLVDRGMVLSNEDVIEIRGSRESGAVLAARYGVSQALICRIRKWDIWRND